MNLHVVQFQYGSELRKLMYPQFVQTFQDIVGRNFWQRQKDFVPSCIEILDVIVKKSENKSA